jgi:TonB family protein
MPTCFLKRVLPFALALVVGLMLVKFLGINGWRANRMDTPQRVGVLVGGNGFPDGGRVFKPGEVDQKAQIIYRAQPQYTEEARANAAEGTVVLRAVFSADSQVTNVRVVSGLPYGLTERAVEAAREIRFTPAMKDGRAVSQYIQIEYNFNLY